MSFINLEQLDQENSLIDYHKKINETFVTLSNTIHELQIHKSVFNSVKNFHKRQHLHYQQEKELKFYILRMKQQNTCLAKDFVDQILQLQLEEEQLLIQLDFIQHIYESIQPFNRIIFILFPHSYWECQILVLEERQLSTTFIVIINQE
ncbi:unnamed protein product [Paramecium pentaurelia]|uniref:Uncharacterized protein n=1 Tax=Paramecium pentaurelia TaxID=43138 RepID=A0A8S1TIE0_9CILI|nr:unnamed protein product [Paramecium pentaurelia]